MSLNRWFRLSSYLTLALSCSALVYAENLYLPALQVCLAPVLVLLVLAWWIEGRWALPAWAVNLLGACIVAGGVTWLVRDFLDQESLLSQVAIHLALLPYMGPLVMATLLVQMFRPQTPGDFWRLQGLGLVQIALGCVLDGGSIFGMFLAGYLVSALTCLALRYRLSVTGERPAVVLRWLAPFLLRWLLLMAGPTLLLFLLTPRRGESHWELLNSLRGEPIQRVRSTAGGSGEINLNGTGTIEIDDEIAFRVVAVDSSGKAKEDLSPEQRWRGAVMEWYERGKWLTPQPPMSLGGRTPQAKLPHFGEGQFTLTYTIPPYRTGSLVLAEPIRFGTPDARLPVIVLWEGRPSLFVEMSGTLVPQALNIRRELRYMQVVPVRDGSSRVPADGILSGHLMESLIRQPVRGLKEWTIDQLRRQAAEAPYRLPAGAHTALENPLRSFLLMPEHWEAVARVLNDFLAHSREYTYSLEMTRTDLSLDPVMDFLQNVKQGHCERYATALALMLRSVGIPARVVKGFRGAEAQGDGVYVVRNRHAHAWVEILVPSREFEKRFDWLTLDPTPGDTTETKSGFSLAYLWQESRRWTVQLWRSLIIDYSADEQADLWNSLQSGERFATLLMLGLGGLTVGSVVVLFVWLRGMLRQRRKKRLRTTSSVAFYERLLHLLGRYASFQPAFGQTPLEYAQTAQQLLHGNPGLASWSDLPLRVIELFYRVRFGGRPLSEEERSALISQLMLFAQALRKHRRATTP